MSCFLEGTEGRSICQVCHWTEFAKIHGAEVQVLCRTATVVFELRREFFFYKVWHHTVTTGLTPGQATCSNTN